MRKRIKTKTAFRRWQKNHPNFMTPEIIRLRARKNTIIETSKGRGFKGENIYGVSTIRRTSSRFSSKGGKMFYSKSKASAYSTKQFNKLKMKRKRKTRAKRKSLFGFRL
jgi:hypothetical protein